MRHLWSLLAGLVAAPLTWLLIAMGQGGSARTVTGWVESGGFDTTQLIEPAAYLAVAGILLGLLGTLRVSPVGPILASVLLIGPYVGMFAAPFAVRDAVPADWRLLGDPLPLRLPLDNGTLFLLGLLLLIATFSAQRRQRRPGGPVAADAEPVAAEAGPVATQPAETQPAEPAEPVVTQPAEPAETEPVAAEPSETQPAGTGEESPGVAPADPPVDSPATGSTPKKKPTRSGKPVVPAPRRETESPWKSPPRTTDKREGTTE